MVEGGAVLIPTCLTQCVCVLGGEVGIIGGPGTCANMGWLSPLPQFIVKTLL